MSVILVQEMLLAKVSVLFLVLLQDKNGNEA